MQVRSVFGSEETKYLSHSRSFVVGKLAVMEKPWSIVVVSLLAQMLGTLHTCQL